VFDKSKRDDGTFSREDFVYDEVRDVYTCPAGKTLTTTRYILFWPGPSLTHTLAPKIVLPETPQDPRPPSAGVPW
jgi:hypothetical protein